MTAIGAPRTPEPGEGDDDERDPNEISTARDSIADLRSIT
jgi:hypothetical protein